MTTRPAVERAPPSCRRELMPSLRNTFRNIWTILVSLGHRQAPYESNPELDVRNEQAVRLPHAVSIAFGAMGFLIAAYIWAPR